MSAPAPAPPRSRLRLGVGITALVVLLGVGAAYGWHVYKTRFPNLLDREQVNTEQVAALKEAALPAAPAAPADAGWPQWRGPNRDGNAPAGPLRTDWAAKPPKPLWTAPCGGGFSSFAVVGGKVYTQDYDGKSEGLVCLDAESGAVLWRHETPADYSPLTAGYASGPRATPAVHGGKVFAVGATGTFACVDPPTEPGKPAATRWQHDLSEEFGAKVPSWGYACSPLVEGDTVIVQPGGRDGSVVAFDVETGRKVWAAEKAASGYSSPVAATCAGVRQVIAVTGESILGLRPDDGKVLWRQPWATSFGGNVATPIVVGDYVFVSSGYGKGCVLLKLERDGEGVKPGVVYFRKGRVMQNHHSSSVYRAGYLFGYDNDTLKCVDFRTGEENEDWIARDDKGRPLGKGSVILADRYLIGLTQNGRLFLAEAAPEQFRFLGQVEGVLEGDQCWAAPVLVGGRIYLRDQKKIVCLDVRP